MSVSSTIVSNSSSSNGINSSSSSTNGNRLQELIQITPPVTIGIIATCTTLYIIFDVLLDINKSSVTFCPQLIIYHGQVYRIVTGAIFHSNTIHILMNMMSSHTLCTLLEQQIGSFRLLYTIVLSMIVTSCLTISAAVVLSIIFEYDSLMYQHSIGFSGILFHLSVLECHINPNMRRNLFGMFEIPSYLYPWVLLIALQIMIPNLSFSGHLAGIVAGTMQVYGWLNPCFMKEQKFLQMDQQQRYISSYPTFIPTNTSCVLFTQSSSSNHWCRSMSTGSVHSRFHSMVASIQQSFRRRFQQRSSNINDGNEIDDNEWNGLPTASLLRSSSSSKEPESLIV